METSTFKNKTAITLDFDAVKSLHNDASLHLNTPIRFEANSFESYIKDAKRILNKESHKLNDLGIKRLLAALIYEVIGNDNYGDEN